MEIPAFAGMTDFTGMTDFAGVTEARRDYGATRVEIPAFALMTVSPG